MGVEVDRERIPPLFDLSRADPVERIMFPAAVAVDLYLNFFNKYSLEQI